jgi:2'-5' RNA ligase
MWHAHLARDSRAGPVPPRQTASLPETKEIDNQSMKTPDDSWRLFVAIELPSSLRQTVTAHVQRLRDAVPEARASWTREENVHLTLKFFGDTPLTKVESVSQATKTAVHKLSPFELIVGDSGAFPPRGQPRVLWIGIHDPAHELHNCYQALEEAYEAAGFVREPRPFHPHLTIARLRQPHGARRLAELHKELGFAPVAVNVRDICLIRSELSTEGSRYTAISRHHFPP